MNNENSSCYQIGTPVDDLATASLETVRQAFDHAAMAADLSAGIRPLSDEDVWTLAMAGPFAFVFPAFTRLVVNGARRMLADRHTNTAQSLLNE